MAYMNQEKKAVIVAAVKKVLPKDWKASFRVDNHSTIIMTIASAPLDLMETFKLENPCDNMTIHRWHVERLAKDNPLKALLTALDAAMNTGNWDDSDIMTDYFNVGHYAYIKFGKWNKPFVNTSKK